MLQVTFLSVGLKKKNAAGHWKVFFNEHEFLEKFVFLFLKYFLFTFCLQLQWNTV